MALSAIPTNNIAIEWTTHLAHNPRVKVTPNQSRRRPGLVPAVKTALASVLGWPRPWLQSERKARPLAEASPQQAPALAAGARTF